MSAEVYIDLKNMMLKKRESRMTKFPALAVLVLILGGCASPSKPIPLAERTSQSYQVQVQKIVVDNLAIEGKENISGSINVNGWAPMAPLMGIVFSPPLSHSFVSKVRNSISQGGSSGRVDISVLRTGFFVEKTVADDIAFVGLLTLGKERGHKCDVDINIKTENDSRRAVLSYEVRRPYFDSHEEVRLFIETCQADLIRQLVDLIRK